MEINRENISLNIPILNKLVYLRRLLEITDDKGSAFDILSNVFHKRATPTKPDGGAARDMTPEEVAEGCGAVSAMVPDFDYATMLALVTNRQEMKSLYEATGSNYEKLHIYRIIFDDSRDGVQSPVVLKFINEAFHVENNYIYQLNPREFQLVPQFFINECDKYVAAVA